MINDIYTVLFYYATDAEMKILSLEENKIQISVSLPSQGGESWLITSDDVIHLDLSPILTLGHIEFGSLSLLPQDYLASRNIDYGDKKDEYRVAHITDIDEKVGYLILYGKENIVKDISNP